MGFESTITSAEGLREVYRDPSTPSLAKQIDHLDENCRAFIAHAPFLVLASSDDQGRSDVSPKGGPPGFVTVLDEHRLGIPDLSGNNRLDSMENLVRSAGIGLLFLIPGLDETLRVNGRAEITTDPVVLDACTVRDIRPRVVIGVNVEEAFIHCAKALRRAGIWETAAWPDLGALPSAASMLRDHCALPELDLGAMEQRLEASYSKTTWLAGGEDPPA